MCMGERVCVRGGERESVCERGREREREQVSKSERKTSLYDITEPHPFQVQLPTPRHFEQPSKWVFVNM